jgi:TRAP-type C4-dicarboxylate transport system permease small subunit
MSLKLKIKHIWNHLLLQLSLILFAFYLTIGCLFLFTDNWIDFVPVGRNIIGGILVIFGCIRFYNSYRRYRTKHEKILALKKEKLHLEEVIEESKHVQIK